jgi:hypothetical protein
MLEGHTAVIMTGKERYVTYIDKCVHAYMCTYIHVRHVRMPMLEGHTALIMTGKERYVTYMCTCIHVYIHRCKDAHREAHVRGL